MVPWSVLEPNQTEKIAAVLLGRKHPRALRVRPAPGDGGIDVRNPAGDGRDDVYQIKWFPTALTDSRKRQIRASLNRVEKNVTVVIREWYLVAPLNPSADELDWFRGVTTDRAFPCHWFGLDQLELLAVEFPEVIDYYVRDGRDRLEQSIAQLRQLVGIVPGRAEQLLTPDDTTTPLAALYRTLNRDDPHLRYEFEVGAEPLPAEPRLVRPGLIVSASYTDNGVSVTHHVYGKYLDAVEDRPIPLGFNIDLDRMDDAVLEEWQRALDYGTPVRLPEGVVTRLEAGLPGGLAREAEGGSLWMRALPADGARPYNLRLQVVAPGSRMLASALARMEPVTAGLSGAGIRAHGQDVGGAFSVEILTRWADDRSATGSIIFQLLSWTGLPPAALRPGIRFLGALGRPNHLGFAPEFGPAVKDLIEVLADEPPVTPEAVELVEALADIQEQVQADLKMPALDEMTVGNAKQILQAAQLVRGEAVHEGWSDWDVNMDPAIALPDGPAQLALAGSYRITVGDQEVLLDPVTMVLLAAQASRDESDPSTVHLRPTLGNATMISRFASIDEVPPARFESRPDNA